MSLWETVSILYRSERETERERRRRKRKRNSGSAEEEKEKEKEKQKQSGEQGMVASRLCHLYFKQLFKLSTDKVPKPFVALKKLYAQAVVSFD